MLSAKLLLFVILASCGSTGFNYSYIESWTSLGQEAEPYDSAYIASFKKKNQSLNYIAANHTNDIQSPTFKTIKRAIDQLSPQIIILEGFSSDKGVNPEGMIRHGRKCSKSKFSSCGESAYAIYLANQKGISFIGAEPTDPEVMKEMAREGYTGLDIASFYLLRQIPQLRRQRRLKSQRDFPEQAESFLKSFSKHLEHNQEVNFSLFKSWYDKHNHQNKSFYDFNSSDAGPVIDGSYFQQVSSKIGFIRERAINKIIETKLHEHLNVLVIYGAGHLVKSRKLYEDYFGKPEHIKWF